MRSRFVRLQNIEFCVVGEAETNERNVDEGGCTILWSWYDRQVALFVVKYFKKTFLYIYTT